MNQGKSNITILKEALAIQCAGLGWDESLYETSYPRPGEPILRSIQVGEYLVTIHRKHPDDVFPIPVGAQATIEIKRKLT